MNFEFEIIFFIGWLIKLIIFQQVSQYKFKLPILLLLPLLLTLVEYIYYDIIFWGEIFFLPLIALMIKRKESWNWTQYFFYSFFPLVIDDIFNSILGIYVLFVLRSDLEGLNLSFDLFGWLSSIFNLPLYFVFLKVTHLESRNFKTAAKFHDLSRIIQFFNASLVIYFLTMYVFSSLPSLEHEGWININFDVKHSSKLVLFTYVPIFFGFSLYINYVLRKKSEEEVQKVKDEQIVSLSQYSRQMEELYKEVRSFRHDYTNLLSSFNYAIKNKDMAGIEEIYNSVFRGSDRRFKSSKYDIANLSNLENDALKSIVSLKMIEARQKNVNLSVEIEEKIAAPDSIDLMNLLKIVSIFLDNALEATLESDTPSLSFAYFETGTSKIMIIENSTKEIRLNTKEIFGYGISSKGKGRGIGLANVKEILSLYPNVSLQTFSANNLFRHEIRFD